MIKNQFDCRTWIEIVGDLVTERTSPGDTILLKVKFNGTAKPSVSLVFTTYNSDKKHFPAEEDITGWVDEKPYYDIIDDSTGKPLAGEMRRGSSDWKEYIDVRFGPLVQSICKSGGRVFKFEVVNG